MRVSLGAVFAALVALYTSVSAQEVSLKLTPLTPPNFTGNAEVLEPWVKRVNDQGAGVLKIEVIYGLSVANHANSYDRLLNDVVQMSFVSTSSTTGKFNKINVVGLPFLAEKSEIGSAALWRLYKTGLLDDEFDQTIPTQLIVFPQIMPHYRSEPKTYANFNGLKVLANGVTAIAIVTKLGGSPVTTPFFQHYEVLQRGVADAGVLNYSSFETLKLAEVTKVHVEINLGTAPGAYLMGRSRFNALPEAARKILDANATEKDSRGYGAYWDRAQEYGRKLVSEPGTHKMMKLPEDILADWGQKFAPIEQEWVRDTPNVAVVLAKYKEFVKQVSTGM